MSAPRRRPKLRTAITPSFEEGAAPERLRQGNGAAEAPHVARLRCAAPQARTLRRAGGKVLQ